MMVAMATPSTTVGTLITVAPTGAEHAKADLPQLPTTLEELVDRLDQPFTDEERDRDGRGRQRGREEQEGRRRDRQTREVRGEFKRHGKGGRPGGRGHPGKKRR